MDSQMNSELLNKILEYDIILLSSCESDIDLLGLDLDVELEEGFDTIKQYSIIDKLRDGPPTHHTKHQYSLNSITSTLFSTVSHSLSPMTTIETHSTINITSLTPTPTTSHNDIRQSTTPVHTRTTTSLSKSPNTHILKTLRQHTTVNISSPSKSPHYTHPQKQFYFHFLPNRPNYISKLNLPMNLARLWTEFYAMRSFQLSK